MGEGAARVLSWPQSLLGCGGEEALEMGRKMHREAWGGGHRGGEESRLPLGRNKVKDSVRVESGRTVMSG